MLLLNLEKKKEGERVQSVRGRAESKAARVTGSARAMFLVNRVTWKLKNQMIIGLYIAGLPIPATFLFKVNLSDFLM